MNERIKLLAKQASENISYRIDPHTFKHIDDPNGPHTRVEFDKEKFAELIVQECADICYHHSNAAGGVDTHFGYGYKDCGDDIKRNFGVKK